jgi:hypothetical protein
MLYFTSTSNMYVDSLFQTTHIFAVDLDQSALEILPNYYVALPPDDVQGGGTIITAMQIDTVNAI